MRDHFRRSAPTTEKVDNTQQALEGIVGLVWRGTEHHLFEMAGPKIGGARSRVRWERPQSPDYVPSRHLGAVGMEGGSTWGCLARISFTTSMEAWARPAEDRNWMAFLYCPASTARRAYLALAACKDSEVAPLGLLRRCFNLPSAATTSAHSPVSSPALHLLILAHTHS